ncbi:MAG: hypothetical protein AAF705_15145, partial [Bacteroidota bacterium]
MDNDPKVPNQAEINYLFRFLERKGINYLDVQVELVDHLAMGLEEIWNKNPGLPLELAVKKIHDRFGIFGFGKIIQEKRQLLFKATIKKLHLDIIRRMTAPQVAASFMVTLLLTYLLMTYSPGFSIFLSLFLVIHLIIASIGFQHRKASERSGHRFLFLEAPFRYMSRVLNLGFLGLMIWFFANQTTYLSFPFALFASIAMLYLILLVS